MLTVSFQCYIISNDGVQRYIHVLVHTRCTLYISYSEDLILNISREDLIIKQIVWQNQSYKLANMVSTRPVLAVMSTYM